MLRPCWGLILSIGRQKLLEQFVSRLREIEKEKYNDGKMQEGGIVKTTIQ